MLVSGKQLRARGGGNTFNSSDLIWTSYGTVLVEARVRYDNFVIDAAGPIDKE